MIFPITPKATPRPRIAKRGKISIAYYPKEYQAYKDQIKQLAGLICKNFYSGPLSMKINFYMPIPASLSKKKKAELVDQWHIKKPDCDNLAKGVKDALEGIAYVNDSQICNLVISKVYSIKPRIEVDLCEIKSITID